MLQLLSNPISLFFAFVLIVYVCQRLFQKLLVYFVNHSNNLIIDDIAFILSFLSKILAGFMIIFYITFFFNLSPAILIIFSTVILTVISLSSIQIINNLIGGLIIILFLKPYKVYDYIAISGMEGVVIEMSLNYTKIKSIDGNYILIPNRNILKSDITNFTIYKDKEAINAKITNLKRFFDDIDADVLTQYTFQLSAPIETMSLHKYAFNKVFDEFEPKFGYKPKYFTYFLGQKIDYQLIVFALSSRTIRKNLKDFKMRLIEELHSTNLKIDILKNPNTSSKETF